MARLVIGLVLFAAAASALIWTAGSSAIARFPAAELAVPADFPAEELRLAAPGEPDLAGWLREGSPECGPVMLLHGRGATKLQMLGRARLLGASGFPVALFDLSGHGESGGETMGFGYAEAADVARIVAALEERFPDRPMGAIGLSLGAAALVFAAEDRRVDAYVLEQLFSTLRDTAAARLPFGGIQADLMLAQMPLRLGYGAADVRPVDRIGGLGAPVLMLAATQDPFVGREQTEALFQAAGGEKDLVWFEVRGHIDLQRHDPERYADAVAPFLTRHLCRPAESAD